MANMQREFEAEGNSEVLRELSQLWVSKLLNTNALADPGEIYQLLSQQQPRRPVLPPPHSSGHLPISQPSTLQAFPGPSYQQPLQQPPQQYAVGLPILDSVVIHLLNSPTFFFFISFLFLSTSKIALPQPLE